MIKKFGMESANLVYTLAESGVALVKSSEKFNINYPFREDVSSHVYCNSVETRHTAYCECTK